MGDSMVNYQLSLSETGADHQTDMERYRSGHNEAVLKTVCPKGRVGSNPTLSGQNKIAEWLDRLSIKTGKIEPVIYRAIWRSTQAGRRDTPGKGAGR